MASLRAKNYDKQNTYFENRLPTGSANPYLVVAATLAAGMDGLRNKIEPPKQNNKTAPRVTSNLEEALEHLEKDEVMKEALGEVFVRWFLLEKRSIEIAKVNCKDRDDEKLIVERQLYYNYC
jgi:glutamine synthetase